MELKKWTYDYVGYLAQFANNIKIADNLRNIFPHPYTEENARQFIEFCLNKSEEKEVNRAIFYDNQTVGSINLTFGLCRAGRRVRDDFLFGNERETPTP